VEASINSRPLFQDYTGAFVTPAHFLIGEAQERPPEFAMQQLSQGDWPEYQARRRKLVNNLWQRWQRHYLTTLRKFRCQEVGRSPRVGDPVVIHEGRLAPGEWRTGTITKLYHGRDGHARTAEVEL